MTDTMTDDLASGAGAPRPTYVVPTRAIYSEHDLTQFLNSSTYRDYLAFVQILNESVKGQRISGDYPHADRYTISPAIQSIVTMLERLIEWTVEIPPVDQPRRFGNPAFRLWCDRLVDQSSALHQAMLPNESLHDAIPELVCYFQDSFGNRTRMDYGTGHETNFILWCYGLHQVGVLTQLDLTATVLHVFATYVKLMRIMQVSYMLEPAGSHGVWGLDDYQCLVFYFGSAQLCGDGSRDENHNIRPDSIHSSHVLDKYAHEYLYLSSIAFIRHVKSGISFAETSPMLNDISGVERWEKVNSGMLKLYVGEVLKKLPVIQHMVFGSIFPATWTYTVPESKMPHPRVHHPVQIHAPNLDLAGLESRAPWTDQETLESIPTNTVVDIS